MLTSIFHVSMPVTAPDMAKTKVLPYGKTHAFVMFNLLIFDIGAQR